MKKRKTLLASLLVILIIFNGILVSAIYRSDYNIGNLNSYYRHNNPETQSIMIIIPHQDDELLLAGSVIRNNILKGLQVYVVFTTNGDYLDLADLRIQEAVTAMNLLGVPEENLLFLGYGDQWNTEFKHIYHSPGTEIVTSHNNKTETYGTLAHPDFRTLISGESSSYTRNNFKRDLQDVIEYYTPNEIYAIDFDTNEDHRATSLLCDEVILEILQNSKNYTPKLFKGFAYSTSLFAKEDFYNANLLSTPMPPKELSNNTFSDLDNPSFAWENRVRFMVPSDMLSYNLRSNLLYKCLDTYDSQKIYTIRYAEDAINSDQVFWERRTDSFTYTAETSASSGISDYINDFKLFDTDDITKVMVDYTTAMWMPSTSDTEKSIKYSFPSPVNIGSLTFYDKPNLSDNILKGKVLFSDGTSLQIDGLNKDGSPTNISFDEKKNITSIEFLITSYVGEPGLCEWEVYPKVDQSLEYIKIILDNDNKTFIYKYLCPDKEAVDFDIYNYPHTTDQPNSYKMTLTDPSGNQTELIDSMFTPDTGLLPSTYKLKVESLNNSDIYDEVEIVSYSSINLLRIAILQSYENNYEEIRILAIRVIDKIKNKL